MLKESEAFGTLLMVLLCAVRMESLCREEKLVVINIYLPEQPFPVGVKTSLATTSFIAPGSPAARPLLKLSDH